MFEHRPYRTSALRDLRTVKIELEGKRDVRLGLSHIQTMTLSREVDELHNELMRIECSKNQGSNVVTVERD
ncbi:hypothetical protein J45TS6_35570 [Paenibacillus sp. J45TS6]|nr:hypothetical protein J45TS6_35570 [Paenibacillus sp. J45TS6]